MRAPYSVRTSPSQVISYYRRVARKIRLRHDIFNSLNSSENEDVKAVREPESIGNMVIQHIAEQVVLIPRVELPVENILEHQVQRAKSVTSHLVVPVDNGGFDPVTWLLVAIKAIRGSEVSESIAVGFQEMSQDENVGFDVSDESVI